MIQTGTMVALKASGGDLDRIVSKMENVLVGEPEHHVMMACISLVVALQYPGITGEQLVYAVQNISEHIAILVSGFDDPTHVEGKMN